MLRFIIKNTALACLIAALAAPLSSAETNQVNTPSDYPPLIASVRISEPLEFCGEALELENREVRERLEKELLLMLWDRPQAILWIKRSTRYFPIIEKMLKEHRLPQDLKYVAIAESALRPHVGSPKGAIGFWQFIKSTGLKYGLQIDAEKDERRNVFASTQAAIMYFKDLYAIFGSWTLAAAAYNMGEEGLQAEILAQKTSNFYHLYLPLETQRYIFRIQAAKLIMTDPAKYGYRFDKDDLYPALTYDSVNIECFQETPILLVARAANTDFKAIKDLNPEIRGHFLAAGGHKVLIPQNTATGFQARFKELVDLWLAERDERVYVVEEGDNLTLIAERFNVPLKVLKIWNRLGRRKYIHPGDRLVIYSSEVGGKEE